MGKTADIMTIDKKVPSSVYNLMALTEAQSIVLHLFVEGYNHVTLGVHHYDVHVECFTDTEADNEIACGIIRQHMTGKDILTTNVVLDFDPPYVVTTWRRYYDNSVNYKE